MIRSKMPLIIIWKEFAAADSCFVLVLHAAIQLEYDSLEDPINKVLSNPFVKMHKYN